MNKVCNFCGNMNFTEKKIQYIYKHDNNYLIVNNVPCDQCEYCGEQYFEANVLKKIEKDYNDIYLTGKKAKSEITVPLEEFVEL
ncbi:MAG: YgiT-type zinc finger protein [Nitrospirae bacterium]|nr:YgiT-type zinc finger protein [Nitrospirota bacterium]